VPGVIAQVRNLGHVAEDGRIGGQRGAHCRKRAQPTRTGIELRPSAPRRHPGC
jgi:hypothetical protein